MSEKKRKRTSEDQGRPSKRKGPETRPGNVAFSVVSGTGEWVPAIASTPGLDLPTNVPLKVYKKSATNVTPHASAAGRSVLSESEILLHSEAHPRLDYIAREEASGEADSLLQHYVGVYDPKTGELQIVPARNMVVRTTLRSARVVDQATETKEALNNYMEARNVLGKEFGTKKAQKAIRSRTDNAIGPVIDYSKPSAGLPSGQPAHNPVAAAIMEAMSQESTSMPTREDLQAAVDEAKPRPQANAEARTPAEVYPVEDLIGEDILRDLKVKKWQDTIEGGGEVHTKSRFVARRLKKVVKSGDVKKLKVLRFALLLVDWYNCLKTGPKSIKKLPMKEDMRKAVGSDIDYWILDRIRKKFAPDVNINSRAQVFLFTTICALALAIDNYEVDIFDLREDLKLDTKILGQYFREIGCKVESPSETERAKMKLTKAESAAHRIAKLRLPLDFPKNRKLPLKRR